MKFLSKSLSIIFLPFFNVTYFLIILLTANPYAFLVNNIKWKTPFILSIFFMTAGFPVLINVLLKSLKLIDSIQLPSRHDRIIPYIGSCIFYLWAYITLRSNFEIPMIFKAALLGGIIGLFLLFFFNNFIKVSAHTASIASLAFSCLFLAFSKSVPNYDFSLLFPFSNNPKQFLSIFICLICVLVAFSRYYLKAHTLKEIFGGFLIGIVSQLIAIKVYF